MQTIKGNEYLIFSTFFNQYQKYIELGDYANSKNYLIEAEFNYCFAAECLLKGVLNDNGVRMRREHDLLLLYEKLPEEYKKRISSAFNTQLLSQHKINFEKCRYFYDNPEEFRDGAPLSFDSNVMYVKKFTEVLYQTYLKLMNSVHYFSYDCFDNEEKSHDDNYTFDGLLNKPLNVYLKTYPNVEYVEKWLKIGYDKKQASIRDEYDSANFQRHLEITPLKEGTIQISVSLDSSRLKKMNRSLESSDDAFVYHLNNSGHLYIKVPRKKECVLISFFKKIFGSRKTKE